MVMLLVAVAAAYVLMVAGVTVFQRQLLYFPSHKTVATPLREWQAGGKLIGYAREVDHPKNLWLMLHGNAGQAAHRGYALTCLSPGDSFYVLEYPGYGSRPGAPSQSANNGAALEAYEILRAAHPGVPVCVLGESIGCGPAAFLASAPKPPDKIVLVVPFDRLADVAAGHFPFLPARWLLFDRWDNIAALRDYRGKVEIFGAPEDEIIPLRHALNLAAHLPGAVLHEIPGGHNDWSATGTVMIRN